VSNIEYFTIFKAITCEYACVFGISYNITEIPSGHTNVIFRHGSSFQILAGGQNSTVYWFYFEKLDKKYSEPDIPRFTEEDTVKTCEEQLDVIIAEDVTFRKLWMNRKSAVKVPIEEGLISRWHYGRIAVLGDAANKVNVRRTQSSEVTAIDTDIFFY